MVSVTIEQLDDVGAGGGGGVGMIEEKAKRALVGAGARILFYPTLAYNVFRNKIQPEFRWWDRVHEFVLLGAVPFPSDVPELRRLGVRGVVTLNEAYETLVPSDLYQAHEIDHLVIPTRDYLFAPSFEDINRAVDFIHQNASCGRTTYVHCKAGRGRSTTIVLCYLIAHRNMTPEAALNHVRSIRPRVLLAPSQWQAVQEYSQLKNKVLSNSIETCCKLNLIKEENIINSVEDEETSTILFNKCFSERFNEEDLILSFFQIALPSPQNPCKNNNSIIITGEEIENTSEEDFEGYDMCTDVSTFKKEIQSQSPGANGDDDDDAYPKPAIIKRLTCLFGALKVSANCEPPSGSVAEIGAC